MSTVNNKLYTSAIQALGAKRYLKTVEEKVESSKKAIADFYKMLENEEGIICWSHILADNVRYHYYIVSGKKSKEYDDEAEMIFDLAVIVGS